MQLHIVQLQDMLETPHQRFNACTCSREVTERDFNTPNSRMEAKLIFKRKEDLNNYSSEPLTETTAQNC